MQQYRHFDRVSFFGEVDVRSHDGSVFLGRFWASDLSETGLFLQTTDEFPAGQKLSITLDLSALMPQGLVLRIYDAEVSWVRPFEAVNVSGDAPGVGLHFNQLSDVVHQELRKYLQEVLLQNAVHDTLPPAAADHGLLASTPGIQTQAAFTKVPVANSALANTAFSKGGPAQTSQNAHAELQDFHLDHTQQDVPRSRNQHFEEIYTSLPPLRTEPPTAAIPHVDSTLSGTHLPSLRPLSLPPMQSSPVGLDDTLNEFAGTPLPSSDGNAALALPAPHFSDAEKRRPRPTLVPGPAFKSPLAQADLDATAQEIPSRKKSFFQKMREEPKASVAKQKEGQMPNLDVTAQEIPSLKPLHVDAQVLSPKKTDFNDVNEEKNLSSIPAKRKDISGWNFRVVSRARDLPLAQNDEDKEQSSGALLLRKNEKAQTHFNIESDITNLNAKHCTEDASAILATSSSTDASWSASSVRAAAEPGGHADELLDALNSEEGPNVLGAELSSSGAWFAAGERAGMHEESGILQGLLDEESEDELLDDATAQLLAGTRNLSSLSGLPQMDRLDDKEAFADESLTGLRLSHVADADLQDTSLAFGPLDSSLSSERYVLGNGSADESDPTPLSMAGETKIPSSLSQTPPRWRAPLLTVMFLGLGAAVGVGIALYEGETSASNTNKGAEAEVAATLNSPLILSVAEAELELAQHNAEHESLKKPSAKNTVKSVVSTTKTKKVGSVPQKEKGAGKNEKTRSAPPVVTATNEAKKEQKPAQLNLPRIEHKRVTVALVGGKVVKKFGLNNPPRVVVDLEGATFPSQRVVVVNDKGIAKLRYGRPVPDRIRLVVELKNERAPRNISVLKKAGSLAVAWQ